MVAGTGFEAPTVEPVDQIYPAGPAAFVVRGPAEKEEQSVRLGNGPEVSGR